MPLVEEPTRVAGYFRLNRTEVRFVARSCNFYLQEASDPLVLSGFDEAGPEARRGLFCT